MAILDLYSKRQRRLRGEIPDVYTYGEIPEPLRVQIVYIVDDAMGSDKPGHKHAAGAYELIDDILCREYGLIELTKGSGSFKRSVFKFLHGEKSVDKTLDAIELCFKIINTRVRNDRTYRHLTIRKIEPDEAIRDLNERFKEHGVGFQFESGKIIRVDSQFLHSEAVKPTLLILRAPHYKGANEEFLKSHEHYRHGRYKECLVDALKSFESTMKAICGKRGWTFRESDTAKSLINTCLTHGLLPPCLQSQMGALRSLLESGVPTVRNRFGGHGQGRDPVQVPEYMARYALNLTASNILFLAEAEAAMK